ncbi:MAG: ABC-2 family transporter protein [Oscillospiraceae bacterium]|jgi:ABC-2 type transport system permease protein|nr:ABC-2 family transporter protein [Oscillospiraceae bacterium]
MKLYFKYFALHLKSQMQYKITFALNILGRIVMSFATVTGVLFMLTRFHEVDGFTVSQVLLCTSVVSMAFSVAEVFARGFDIFPQLLGNGEFDRALVRPRGIIFQILASHIEFIRLGIFMQAAAVLCYAIPKSGVNWTPNKIVTLVLMITCGAAVFFGLYIVYASFAFFTTEGLEFMNILTHGGREFGRYPFAIYGGGVLKFLTYIVPLALFQYYPLLYLLGRTQNSFYMLAPILALVFLIPCYAFFRAGLRRYKSTGS